MSRSRSAIMTWGAFLVFTAVTMATGLVATPLIIDALGDARFGVVRALTEAFGYLALVGQGITVALVPVLSSAKARGDDGALHRTLAAAVRLFGLTAFGAVALGLAALPALSWLLRVGPGLRGELRVAWLVGLAGLPLMTLTPLKVLIEVNHRGYLVNLLMTVQGALTAVLSVLLARAGWGVAGILLATLAASLLFHGLLVVLAAALDPGLAGRVAGAKPERGDWHAVLGLSGPTFVAMFSERIGLLSDSIVLNGVLGPVAATVLAVTQRLPSLGQTVLNAITNAIWPGLAELHVRGEHGAFNRRLIELTRLIVLLGVAGMAPVVAYNHHFVALWVGPARDGGLAIAVTAAVNGVLLTLAMLFSVAFVSTGRVRLVAAPAAVGAVVNLLASVALSRALGPVGPLLGTTVATLAVSGWYLPWQLARVFGTPISGLVKALAVPLAWGLPYAYLLRLFAVAHPPRGWAGLIVAMGLGALVFLTFSICAILGPADRALWRARLFSSRRPSVNEPPA
ncbi:MAG: polysaccharide biosynthesis C-terminal domain-containing protein [Isosphaeraceae bacterium]|nr:polysaccharide biosynthesis C-terminal domain-containing protein [Isosphaeraceae bacterium]